MKKLIRILALPAALILTVCTAVAQAPFGTEAHQQYGDRLWQQLEEAGLVGDGAMMARPYQGTAPHGEIIVTLEHELEVDGETGALLVKRNYMGDDATIQAVSNNPAQYLDSITVMFQRAGYDPENNDWFWAKYRPDGSYDTAPNDADLVGSPTGCVSCHSQEEDRVFLNDRY
jgi:hypothetical protein